MPDRPSIIFDTVDLHYLREQRQAAIESDLETCRVRKTNT